MGYNTSHFKGENLPVESVTWNDAQVFCRKLSEKTGKNYRLPTDREWIYAAQGGKYLEKYDYAGSNRIKDIAIYNYEGIENAGTREVGSKKPNSLDIYDMTGNVWEWCLESHKDAHIVRGGSWHDDAKGCKLKERSTWSSQSNRTGFRIALSE
jgi:formylglycine-generating enzyme required for sulfatase activity